MVYDTGLMFGIFMKLILKVTPNNAAEMFSSKS